MTIEIVYLGGAMHGVMKERLAELVDLGSGKVLTLNVSVDAIPEGHDPKVVIVSTATHKTLKRVKAAQELFPNAVIIVRGFRVDGLDEDIPVVSSELPLRDLLDHFPSSIPRH